MNRSSSPPEIPPRPLRGLIIHAQHAWEQGRLVIRLWGRLEDGRSFLYEDDRFDPYFFGAADQQERFQHSAVRIGPTDFRGLDDRALVRVTAEPQTQFPAVLRAARESRLITYEADLRLATRYLIDHGITSSIEFATGVSPEPRTGSRAGGTRIPIFADVVFRNVEIRSPKEEAAQPTTLSFDIETDPNAEQLLSIALAEATPTERWTEVLIWCPDGLPCPDHATGFETIPELLEAFIDRVRTRDPDVLTGWNIQDFDLPVLERIADRHRVRLELGRSNGRLELPSRQRPQMVPRIPGRVVLDGIWLLRGAFVRMESYTLDAVARSVLGTGKVDTTDPLAPSGADKAAAILRLFKGDRQRFVDYNRTDATLVLDILEELDVLDLSFERSRLTGLTPDRVSGSIAAFDFLYLSRLREKRIAAPSLASVEHDEVPTHGGTVLESKPGLHPHVLVFDFKSLYPSVIRTLQIDPWGYVSGRATGSRGRSPHRHTERCTLSATVRNLDRGSRPALPQPRSREESGQLRRESSHQDPDELSLRSPGHARLSVPTPARSPTRLPVPPESFFSGASLGSRNWAIRFSMEIPTVSLSLRAPAKSRRR